jgi:hypothetical protein
MYETYLPFLALEKIVFDLLQDGFRFVALVEVNPIGELVIREQLMSDVVQKRLALPEVYLKFLNYYGDS